MKLNNIQIHTVASVEELQQLFQANNENINEINAQIVDIKEELFKNGYDLHTENKSKHQMDKNNSILDSYISDTNKDSKLKKNNNLDDSILTNHKYNDTSKQYNSVGNNA